MRKSLSSMLKALALAVLVALPAQAGAKQLLSDDFNAYTDGALYGQGGWIRLDAKQDQPIQVAGGKVTLDGKTSTSAERLKKSFSDTPVTSGTLAYSAAICPNSVAGLNKYALIGFAGKNYSGFGDGKGNGSIYAVVSVAPGSDASHYKIGLAASTAVPTYASTEYALGKLVNVTVTYDFTTKNICLYIDPANDKAEAAVTLTNKGSISTTNGVQGICLYQGCSSNVQAQVTVDNVTVGETLADVLGTGGGDTPVTPPAGDEAKGSFSNTMLAFDNVLQGSASAPADIMFSGENLTEDITFTTSDPAFTVTPATISADVANSDIVMKVVFAPTEGKEYAATLTATHGTTVLATMKLSGTGIGVTEYSTYNVLSNNLFYNSAPADTYLCLKSSMGKVTYVDAPGNRFFVQDALGALEVKTDYATMPNVKVGDKIKKFYCMVIEGALYLVADIDPADITASTPREPSEVTLADLKADPESYWNKLVKITDLQFAKAGENFAAGSTAATDADGNTVNVRPFAGTDLIGTAIPTKGSVTGIALAKNGTVIWPRGLADVVSAAEEATLDVTIEKKFTGTAAPIGETVTLATLHFEYANLTQPVSLWLSGKNRAMFALSSTEIPAGSGTQSIDVLYTPTAIGAHSANIGYDAVPTELSGSLAVTAKAYDPANLPVINAPESLEPFTAKVGEQAQQQFTISSVNMIEAGTVRVAEQSTPGTFIISSTSLYPNIDANFTVTFKPQVAGEYTATLAVEGLMAETRTITLSGVATGEIAPEEKEGTELTLDTTSPLKLLNEPFDGATNNKPLAAEGWDNVAMQGTRAWWGYTFADDGNSAAKVTSYDSKAEDNTPAQMLLVTPALNFKIEGDKLLTFRVMGDFMPESSEGTNLDVLYIEDADYMESLGNLGIPCTSDHNKEWLDLQLDLADLPIADTFFIGFRYTAPRGRDNTTVYYIDDVTWGLQYIPHIKARTSDDQNAAVTGVTMEGVLGATSTSDALTIVGRNLTADIAVKVTGANASRFSTSAETLPAAGGSLSIHFTPEEAGLHEAYIELSSADAPTIAIPVAALAKADDPSGITDAVADDADAEIYNLQGIRLTGRTSAKDLPAGVYIIGGKKMRVN